MNNILRPRTATKIRYAQVGLGERSLMYSYAAAIEYAENSQWVGLCDQNSGRLDARLALARQYGLEPPPAYPADQFDRMIAETHPDVVIVTTMDSTHDEYICRAMESGCDVITEKPMTTDAAKCQRILDTKKRTGRNITVTFNYRYAPARTQVKDLLMSGVIGEVHSVDFHWLLDTNHGADYFRRWHRHKRNSGGLFVHKATHHFDLVNWWLSSVPEQVYATGQRSFYIPQTADRYGLRQRSDRCLDCTESLNCPYYLDLQANENHVSLYLQNEHHDGYFRDRCVFSPEIDIEDNMQAIVDYRSGARMSYSLHAFMPWEGYTITFNGSKGRLEHSMQETTYISGDGSTPGELIPQGTRIKILPHFQSGYEVPIWQAEGGHGGADPLMVAAIFSAQQSDDKYLRKADQRAGAWSILTGIAANRSIDSGQPVRVRDLVSGLEIPDYPPMPEPNEPIDPRPSKGTPAMQT